MIAGGTDFRLSIDLKTRILLRLIKLVDGQIEPYDELASPVLGNRNTDGLIANNNADEQLAFRLEIVLDSGPEGEKLQAIQARAVLAALLWGAQRMDNGDNPGGGCK